MEVELIKCEGLKKPQATFGFSPVPSSFEPYVKVLLTQPDGTSEEFHTDVKSEDLNPAYGNVFGFCSSAVQWAEGSPVPATLVLEVWNHQNFPGVDDKKLGETSISLVEAMRAEGNQSLSIQGDCGGKVHFAMQK